MSCRFKSFSRKMPQSIFREWKILNLNILVIIKFYNYESTSSPTFPGGISKLYNSTKI